MTDLSNSFTSSAFCRILEAMAGNSDWKHFETMVERLQRAFHPHAAVVRNDHLPGHESERSREIDISIRYTLGTTSLLIIVDCKKHSRIIDVNRLEAFQGLMRDVRANAGIIVCEKGFSKAARRIARKSGNIELFTFHDTESSKWQVKVRVPVFVEQWVLTPMVLNVINADGTIQPLSDDRELDLTDIKTGKGINVADLLVSGWNQHPEKKDGMFCWEYNAEPGSQDVLIKLQIGCRAERQRFTRSANLSLIGLTKIEDGLTYTDKLDIATDAAPPIIHTVKENFAMPEGAPWGVLITTTITKTKAFEKSGIDLKKNSIGLSMTSKGAKPITVSLSGAQRGFNPKSPLANP